MRVGGKTVCREETRLPRKHSRLQFAARNRGGAGSPRGARFSRGATRNYAPSRPGIPTTHACFHNRRAGRAALTDVTAPRSITGRAFRTAVRVGIRRQRGRDQTGQSRSKRQMGARFRALRTSRLAARAYSFLLFSGLGQGALRELRASLQLRVAAEFSRRRL